MAEYTDSQMTDDFTNFRYRRIDRHLIDSLVNPSLYFAKPNSLNDPFDCRIDLQNSFARAASSTTGDRKKWLSQFLDVQPFFENWKIVMDGLGVCCFSSTAVDTLLWAHYADNHRGVCLEYRLPPSCILDPPFRLAAGGAVDYRTEPLTEWLKNGSFDMDKDSFIKAVALIYLRAKSPAWSYEKEARIIRSGHGAYKIRGDFLTQVCFGLHTPQDDIDLILKLARDYCGCIRFGRMTRDGSDFGIAMKRYEPVNGAN
jgi:hypothetical protein